MYDQACSSAAKKCAKRGAFLSPREYLSKFEGLIRNGPERPSAAAASEAEARARFEMTLSAAAIQEANNRLQKPIRIRLAMGVDDHGAARPCARCSLYMDTAFAKARGRCAACDQEFCRACLRKHTCRLPVDAITDDSTAVESSDESGSLEGSWSDISVD